MMWSQLRVCTRVLPASHHTLWWGGGGHSHPLGRISPPLLSPLDNFSKWTPCFEHCLCNCLVYCMVNYCQPCTHVYKHYGTLFLSYSCEIKEVQLCKGGWETEEEQGGEKACIYGCAPEDCNSLVWLHLLQGKASRTGGTQKRGELIALPPARAAL